MDYVQTNIRLRGSTRRALGLLMVKHAPDRTQSEFVDSLIRAAAMSDPDVSGWLQAFPETATAQERISA